MNWINDESVAAAAVWTTAVHNFIVFVLSRRCGWIGNVYRRRMEAKRQMIRQTFWIYESRHKYDSHYRISGAISECCCFVFIHLRPMLGRGGFSQEDESDGKPFRLLNQLINFSWFVYLYNTSRNYPTWYICKDNYPAFRKTHINEHTEVNTRLIIVMNHNSGVK